MKNSIALPIASRALEVKATPRCFVLFDSDPLEVRPYPFNAYILRQMSAARTIETIEGTITTQWCATLFFPEEWPPDIIADFLSPARVDLAPGA
jgi:hypothetical protein